MTFETAPDWMQTVTGKKVSPFPGFLKSEVIDIEDIMHSLSLQCRFNGHCSNFYSVAEHSSFVHDIVYDMPLERFKDLQDFERHCFWALLHDGSESFTSDIPSPVKKWISKNFPGFKQWEAFVEDSIAERFGLPKPSEYDYSKVKEADMIALATEKQELMVDIGEWECLNSVTPSNIKCVWCYTPEIAKYEFERRFEELQKKLKCPRCRNTKIAYGVKNHRFDHTNLRRCLNKECDLEWGET